ncbi:MAG: peptide chain release factor N(5)-glutamine methyltransferase [Pirellulaceae bacterium]
MSTTETWTVGRLLTWTTEYLKTHESTSPRLDAEVLLAHARECERIQLYTAFDEEPAEEQKTAFREMVRRRAEGTPVAYLVGYKEFYSANFEVNPDVLIPRPETEHLIVEAIDRAKEISPQPASFVHPEKGEESPDSDESKNPSSEGIEPGTPNRTLRIADVGTGSGAIAITLANHLANCNLVATDVSAQALEVARRNAAAHETGDRLQLVESDLLSDVEGPFELIVSNPPYVSEAEYADLAPTVRDYEPKTALVAEQDGSELIVRLLDQAASRLTEDGFVIIEFSPMLAAKIESWLPSGWQVERITKDFAGLARVVTLTKSS